MIIKVPKCKFVSNNTGTILDKLHQWKTFKLELL